MNKTGSAAKVKLNSFDDLFGDGQPQAGIEQVQEIALSELHEFKGTHLRYWTMKRCRRRWRVSESMAC